MQREFGLGVDSPAVPDWSVTEGTTEPGAKSRCKHGTGYGLSFGTNAVDCLDRQDLYQDP